MFMVMIRNNARSNAREVLLEDVMVAQSWYVKKSIKILYVKKPEKNPDRSENQRMPKLERSAAAPSSNPVPTKPARE
jgi:hypothetical protein